MSPSVRSKKMAGFEPSRGSRGDWTYPAENGPHRPMADRNLRLDRRDCWPDWAPRSWPCELAAGPGRGPRWRFRPRRTASRCVRASRIRRSGRCKGPELRFRRGDSARNCVRATSCRRPRSSIGAGSTACPASRAAARTGAAGRRRPGKPCNSVAPRRNLPVRPPAAWRWSGAAVAGAGAGGRRERAGRRRPRRGVPDRGLAAARRTARRSRRAVDPKDALPVYTLTAGLRSISRARVHERLRLRFINGCQRTVIAMKIEGLEVRVMALDGQPSEPFPGPQRRAGAGAGRPGRASSSDGSRRAPTSPILLHDGREARPIARLIASKEPPVRHDALPAAAPLPSNGLPAQLDLKNALRVDLALGGPVRPTGWRRRFANHRRPPSAPKPAAPWCWR